MSPNSRVAVHDGHLSVGSDTAGTRVFFFPHAGGSALSLLPLASGLPPRAEGLLFDLPGRGTREDEPRTASFEEARASLARYVAPLLDRPSVFFGHSLGGLLCDAVLRVLTPGRRAWVRKVIVSSAISPGRAAAEAAALPSPAPRRSREKLTALLTGYGGTPSEVLSTPELLDDVITVFGDDLLLLDSYRPDPADPPPGPEYEFWAGREDPFTAPDEPEVWARSTGRPVPERPFPGGHFYLTERPEARVALRHLMAGPLPHPAPPHGQEART
ncbi:thioesterase II family protein [Streptomyces sp. JNUCC 64]